MAVCLWLRIRSDAHKLLAMDNRESYWNPTQEIADNEQRLLFNEKFSIFVIASFSSFASPVSKFSIRRPIINTAHNGTVSS